VRAAAWGLVGAVVMGCGRGSEGAGPSAGAGANQDVGASAGANPDAGASAGANPDAGANADAGPSADARAGTGGACGGVREWGGAYRSVAGALYVPPTWKGVTWRVPETGAGVGEGTIALYCDPATGRLSGRVDGVLGPATVRGLVDDGGVTATVVRVDPSDRGFTGTLSATTGAGLVRGSMNVSLAEASAIRVASFDLTPGGAAR